MRHSSRQPSKVLFVAVAAALAASACAPAAMLDQSQGASVKQAVRQPQSVPVLPVGTVSGVIASFDGKAFVPVVGATVRAEGVSGTAVTDAEGRYTMGGLPSGNVLLTATKEGFNESSLQVTLSPVAGVSRVNIAMAAPKRVLQGNNGTQTAIITGVVTDPRGSALGGATVKVLSNAGTNGFNLPLVTADANGFYTASLPSIAVSALSPSQVQVTARGTSPGGVKLESTEVKALALTSTSLVVNAQCDAFTRPGTPSFPNGSYGPMDTVATLEATNMSSRVDEFYIELSSGGKTYGVLPNTVIITDATPTTLQRGTVTFRIPFTLPANTFTARIVPFGQALQATAASGSFVTVYTQADLDTDVSYAVNSALVDNTTTTGMNSATFLGGETAQYRITLANSSTSVSQDMEVAGTAPVGSTISSITVTPTVGGVAQAPVTLTAANITQPAPADGKWSIRGMSLPTRQGGSNGQAFVQVNVVAPVTLNNGDNFAITGLSARMVSANLTKTVAPADSGNLTVANVDKAAFTITSKTITDVGVANDGLARVTLVLTPTGSAALGRFTLTDTTRTDMVASAAKATITGTETPLPPIGTSLGLTTADKLVLRVDGGAPITIGIPSASMDLETLCGFINNYTGLFGLVNATRTVDNRFRLERTVAGTTRTLQIIAGVNETTDNFLDRVIVGSGTTLTAFKAAAPVATAVAGTDSIIAEYTGTGAAVRQSANTVWGFVTGADSIQNSDGSVTARFSIDPPAAFGGTDTFTTPITIDYRLRKESGAALTLGGGVGATFGASTTFFNLLNPFTDATKNQAMNKTVADPATVNNL